jgi:hypothetical protein
MIAEFQDDMTFGLMTTLDPRCPNVVAVWLNDERLNTHEHRIFAADDRRGWLVRALRDEQGHLKMRGDTLCTEVLIGDVHLEFAS